jgi:hypothetical protein
MDPLYGKWTFLINENWLDILKASSVDFGRAARITEEFQGGLVHDHVQYRHSVHIIM